ncbi:MAG: ankyrin repeat domain-containing protein, partial [Thermoanaerobaculia bacterium]
DGWTPLLFAVRDGHRGSARRLLAAGADVNVVSELGWTPLMWAAREGRTALVGHLVAAGAEIDLATKAGRTALAQAAAQGHAEVVQQLLEAGARPDLTVEGVDAHWWASTGGWPEIEDLLAQASGSVRE